VNCVNCGNKIKKSDSFCVICGKKIENKQEKNNNSSNCGLKIASIVLGILGIIFSLMLFLSPVSFIISLIGLILGICALKHVKNVVGIVLNSIGLFLSVLIIILIVVIFNYTYDNMDLLDFDYDSDIVASIGGEYITDEELYNQMKKTYSYNVLIEMIDNIILTEMYPEDKEMISDVENTAEYYYDAYNKNYGYTKDEFLSTYGYSSEDQFIEYLKLDYRRNEYYTDYVKKIITEEEIVDYYEKNYFSGVELVNVREEIIDILIDEKKNSDQNLYYKSLIHMREEANLNIYDEYLDKKYQSDMNAYVD